MNEEEQEIRYTISQIADELDISTRTIRFYEEKGLIKPQRTSGNQRIYTPRNKARLKLILRGKRFGFSLDEIADMIGMAGTDVSEIVQIEKRQKKRIDAAGAGYSFHKRKTDETIERDQKGFFPCLITF
jgi:DNA-binding transcriptional MerR regulator